MSGQAHEPLLHTVSAKQQGQGRRGALSHGNAEGRVLSLRLRTGALLDGMGAPTHNPCSGLAPTRCWMSDLQEMPDERQGDKGPAVSRLALLHRLIGKQKLCAFQQISETVTVTVTLRFHPGSRSSRESGPLTSCYTADGSYRPEMFHHPQMPCQQGLCSVGEEKQHVRAP